MNKLVSGAQMNVKSTTQRAECWWPARLPYLLTYTCRPSARRWINLTILRHMASAMSDLRLRSQPQNTAAVRLIPDYAAW